MQMSHTPADLMAVTLVAYHFGEIQNCKSSDMLLIFVASEVVRQSNSCDQVSASHLNKCNSSSQAHWADSGNNVDLRGQRSNGGIKGKKSCRPVEGKR